MSGKAVSEEENACEARVLVRGFQVRCNERK